MVLPPRPAPPNAKTPSSLFYTCDVTKKKALRLLSSPPPHLQRSPRAVRPPDLFPGRLGLALPLLFRRLRTRHLVQRHDRRRSRPEPRPCRRIARDCRALRPRPRQTFTGSTCTTFTVCRGTYTTPAHSRRGHSGGLQDTAAAAVAVAVRASPTGSSGPAATRGCPAPTPGPSTGDGARRCRPPFAPPRERPADEEPTGPGGRGGGGGGGSSRCCRRRVGADRGTLRLTRGPRSHPAADAESAAATRGSRDGGCSCGGASPGA